MICGGTASVEVNADHINVLESVKAQINAKLNADHTYTIISVKQQVVAGMNYTYLLATNDGKRVEAKVFKPLPHTNEPAEVNSAVYVSNE